MTIVMQHQYSNLVVEKNHFSVDLSFGGILQTLTIPFDAILYFADPYAKFGLSFNLNEELHKNEDNSEEKNHTEQKVSGGNATVISIDAFRKK